MQLNYFTAGTNIEIIKNTSKSTTSFHPATILLQDSNKFTSKRRKINLNNNQQPHHHDDHAESQDLFLVQHQTQHKDIVSYVGVNEIRPLPPQNDAVFTGNFVENDKVDVLRDGYWIKATIVGVLYEGSKYLVGIDGDNDDVPSEVCRSFLRVHRDWCNGCWIPPVDCHVKKESFEMDQGSVSRPGTISQVVTDSNGKRVTLRFKGIKTLLKTKFTRGTLVEIKSDEDGYQGSWYTATVVRSVGIGKFLVEYRTLTTEDEMKPLRDLAKEQDIRPCPPHILQSNRYNVCDEVDAWYNDGWWEGAIYEVLDEGKYVVYFAPTHEKMVYQHSNLRPRQNWVDGKWIMALQV